MKKQDELAAICGGRYSDSKVGGSSPG